MIGRRETIGRGVSLLALCFCLFTLAQVARPLAATTLRRSPQIATTHHNLTRHALEEVGSQSPTVSAHQVLESNEFPPEVLPQRPRPRQVYARNWPVRYFPIHRRIPPPTSDDTH
jgi:hypothetical protein